MLNPSVRWLNTVERCRVEVSAVELVNIVISYIADAQQEIRGQLAFNSQIPGFNISAVVGSRPQGPNGVGGRRSNGPTRQIGHSDHRHTNSIGTARDRAEGGVRV